MSSSGPPAAAAAAAANNKRGAGGSLVSGSWADWSGSKSKRRRTKTAYWRLDPDVSYSDFAIRVKAAAERRGGKTDDPPPSADNGVGGGGGRVYHVHRSELCFAGAHESGYFTGLLRDGGRFAHKGEIEVDLGGGDEPAVAAAAEAFPLLLDFLYTGKTRGGGGGDDDDGDEDGNSRHGGLAPKEAVALLHLGDRFAVPALVEEMSELVARGMMTETAAGAALASYLPWVIRFRNDPAVEARAYALAVHLTLDAVFDVSGEGRDKVLPRIVPEMDVQFVLDAMRLCRSLVAGQNLIRPTRDDFTSVLAARFLAFHTAQGTVARSDLEAIVDEENIPQVAAEVAVQLLEIEADIIMFAPGDGASSEELTCLQRRCVIALSGNTDAAIAKDAERTFRKLAKPQLAKLRALMASRQEPHHFPGNDCDDGRIHAKIISSDPELCLERSMKRQTGQSSLRSSQLNYRTYQNSGNEQLHLGFCKDGDTVYWNVVSRTSKDPSSVIKQHLYTCKIECDDVVPKPSWGWKQSSESPACDAKLPPMFFLITKPPPEQSPEQQQHGGGVSTGSWQCDGDVIYRREMIQQM